jgi:gentisate 1,2-dioxygenase
VFDGRGLVTIGDRTWSVTRGDMFVVPSWVPFMAKAEASPAQSSASALDLFRFSDTPIFEALHAHRVQVGAEA